MFDKTVTVFNKYVNQKDEIYWYPTVISGCQFVDDKAANVAKTGLENADEANLHIRYTNKKAGTVAETYWNDTNGHNIFDIDGKAIELIADIGKTVYKKTVSGKVYVPPKEWKAQTNDKLAETVTFADGDFFIEGEYSEEVVKDSDYATRVGGGFYDYLNKKRDNVFLITSVGTYTLIPHFEIGGK